jgi:hypothetical protein
MPTEKTLDAKLTRVQNLIAKADDPAATEAEADAFRAKAEELLVAYGIDQAQLESHRQEGAPEEIISKRFNFRGTYAIDQTHLLHYIAVGLGCNGHRSHNARGKLTDYMLFGYESDVERTEFLYASLSLHMRSEAARQVGPDHLTRAQYLKGFHAGYGRRVYERLKEIRDRLVGAAEPGTALVVSDRSRRVEAFMLGGAKLRQSRSRRVSIQGLADGANAGDKADLGQTRVGHHRTQLTR